MDRLDDAQRQSFERVWHRLPVHLHDIVFDLDDPGWSPAEVIENLAGVLCDVLMCLPHTSLTDFAEFTTFSFMLSLPPGTKSVASLPYGVNLQETVDAVLDQNRAEGLTQHSASPCASPLVVIAKKDVSVRITVNCKRFDSHIDLDGRPLSG